jgi:hypothetical protein
MLFEFPLPIKYFVKIFAKALVNFKPKVFLLFIKNADDSIKLII